MIGQTLGHYRIEEKLGEGGMGVVYRAEDTQLGRLVAIKLLPEEYAQQQDRLQRFLSEAKLASSINHPNIVSIYELGEHAGQRFIAMEYVPGESLRALLERKALPLKKLLELALPAAEALARAHRAGVLHRDIKPENLLVSQDGYIKVADFGLAKLKPARTGESTLTEQAQTDAGKVVGTVAYMSPEQLQGQEVDGRSDVFSFGAVLYEMATGKSPFLRGSAASTTAAILRDAPPPVRAVTSDLPPELERLIAKALEKEPDFRYQSMDELAADLRRLRRDLESGRLAATAEAAPSTTTRGGRALQWVGGALIVALVVALGVVLTRRGEETAPPTLGRVVQLTTLPGLEDSPTWSPDGRSIAYVSDAEGNLDIYVQQVGGGRALKLTDSDADDAQPAWSPDGSRIAFVSARAYPGKRLAVHSNLGTWTPFFAGRNGDVWVMPALGGTARRVAENAYFPSWSPDGKSLVYQALREGQWQLWIQAADGAEAPRQLKLDGLDVTVVSQPAWSPDGNWVAFTAGAAPQMSVYVVASAGGSPREVTRGSIYAFAPSWSPDGHWLFFASDQGGQMNLWKARLENGRAGAARHITTGTGPDLSPRPDPAGQRLAYANMRSTVDLWQRHLATGQLVQLTTETTREDNAQPSPDGKWLAFSSNRLGGVHVWLMNRESGSLTQVSSTPQVQAQSFSLWSADSRYLYYAADDGFWRYEVGLGSTTKVHGVSSAGSGFCLARDLEHIVYPAEGQIVRAQLGSGKVEVLVRPREGSASDAACSPDGAWIAFHVQQGTERNIWVVPWTGGEAQQVTFGDTEDSHPVWSADGRLIYFVRNHQDIYVVPRTGGEPKPVTAYRSLGTVIDYPAVSADGRWILFTRNDTTGDIYLLENPTD